MENPHRCKLTVIFFISISLFLALVSFILCMAAEIKRNKEEDLRWSGKLCYLPTSRAFGLSIATLVSFVFAHIIGNSMLLKNSYYSSRSVMPATAKVLFLISWLSFGIAIILLIAATSMSRRQHYGIGWLNGECYLVKRGIYAISAILILVTIGSLNGSAFSTTKSSQAYMDQKIHKKKGVTFFRKQRGDLHNLHRLKPYENNMRLHIECHYFKEGAKSPLTSLCPKQ